MKRKNIVILGSTGTIGVNTLKVIERYPSLFNIVGLSAYDNIDLLEKQIYKFKPRCVAVNPRKRLSLKSHLNGSACRILDVENDLDELVAGKDVETIVIGMRGSAALKPFLAAVRLGKTVAPANKEALVIAGDILMREAKKYKAKIIPIDSEQSAIFQCLEGRSRSDLKKVFLTASGGALWNVPRSQFNRLTVKEILDHPRWKMGKKITVDSATLMNKGFEIMEAKHLFSLNVDQIEVVIHPEAIIHSMVEFHDGSIMAQLGITDMRLPIQYALTYPQRLDSGLKGMDFFQLKQLHFHKPDFIKFPSLTLAIQAAKDGGSLPCVLNAADEVAVDAFLTGKINFSSIYKVVEKVTRKHKIVQNPSLNDIFDADQWARQEALREIIK